MSKMDTERQRQTDPDRQTDTYVITSVWWGFNCKEVRLLKYSNLTVLWHTDDWPNGWSWFSQSPVGNGTVKFKYTKKRQKLSQKFLSNSKCLMKNHKCYSYKKHTVSERTECGSQRCKFHFCGVKNEARAMMDISGMVCFLPEIWALT